MVDGFLLLATGIFTVMMTWKKGRKILSGENPGGLATAGGVFTGDRKTAADKSAWDGNLHERECDADATGIDPQPGTQQSAASAGVVSDGEDEAGAVCGWRASGE